MITNKLSMRMQEIAKLVDGEKIADIGCDHGKIVNYLLLNDKISYAICSDISLPSVNKAKELLIQNGINNSKFDIRHGDGLKTIKDVDRIDTVIISGMGGLEVSKILKEATVLPNTFILQPQKHEIDAKKTVVSLGYEIIYDKIIFEDKFYNIVKAVKSDKPKILSDFELLFGKQNFVDNPDFIQYINYLYEKYTKILSLNKNTNRQDIVNMLELIIQAKQKLENNNE